MNEEHIQSRPLQNAVVRICPACGVVNPSGPSEICPHLQLVRFDGINPELEQLLGEVAAARSHFNSLAARLKKTVIGAARQGEAEVETTRTARPSEVDALRPRSKNPAPELQLVNPEPVFKKNRTAKRPSRKPAARRAIDSRQLELIASEPPKGDA